MTRRRPGFSLIEALVALLIAALVLGAIFELQIQMIRGQQRAVDAMDQVRAQENAIALIQSVNPMAEPEGRIELEAGDVIRWTAEPKIPPKRNSGFPSGDGQFDVQLFTLTVEVDRATGRSPAPMVFDRVGWRRLDASGTN
ncbi:prepilin-type N-terminal cleavage/methylation domain-containing protein [Brevundimonas sp. DC300-4]|uniref:prepilin-type N-terminal cleavage/methylation domain-containing protein n=1 Tax=Brevundimonas sp. DC300-4 TaxID=2804594 RepID=UPI003CF120F3